MIVRQFQPTDEEYEAIYAVKKAVFPDNPSTVEEIKFEDANHSPDHFWQRWVVEKDGRIVAFANAKQPPQSDDPGRYRLLIVVHPDFERQGIGTAVYNQIWQTIQAQKAKPTVLASRCYQHHPQAVRFLEKRGFQQVMRWVISTLNVPQFDLAQFIPLIDQLKTEGIEFITFHQLQEQNENWLSELHELDWELVQDEPLPYTPQKITAEKFGKMVVDSPNMLLHSWIVARANGRLIGNAMLEKGSQPGVVSTGFTGVVRGYRRRGLATALKALTAEYAQKAGCHTIRTGNEENNPMLTLNKKLGFTELTANLAFEKRLDD